MILMEKYCQNPLCDAEAVKQVKVSVKKASDERRSLCACCEEVFVWGVQHGKMLWRKRKQWILAIADKGIIAYAEAYASQKKAEQGLIDYLRKEESYDGPDEITEAAAWLAEHDERLGAEIFAAESPDNHDDADIRCEAERLEQFLAEGGFIVLAENQQDPHPGQPLEAWAYQGSLDFSKATPVNFGLGNSVAEVLAALNEQLEQAGHPCQARQHPHGRMTVVPLEDKGVSSLWWVVHTLEVSAADAQTAAALAYQFMKDPKSPPPVLEIADGQGKVTRVDLSQKQEHPGSKEDDSV